MTTTPFLSDVQELRRRARENMMRGSVTSDYHGDVEQAVDVLNQALATEIVCVLRYKRHYYMSRGIYKDSVAEEFAAACNRGARACRHDCRANHATRRRAQLQSRRAKQAQSLRI